MRFTLSSIVTLALVLSASAAPSNLITVEKYGGQVVQGSYIVRLKAGVDKKALFASDPALREAVTHDDWTVIHGFAGQFNSKLLNKLRASDAVESIAEDGVVTIQAVQTDAPWGLSRLSSGAKLPSGSSVSALNYTYTYPDSPYNGSGVDVYVVDTGINLNHIDFGGRARFGWTGSGLNQTDDHGHGTHCSGTIGGTRWGVAKGVDLISVKVLNSAGSGTLANVVGGFNYVQSAAAASGRPSVASASLGGGASTAIDDSVASLVASGVTVVVAAGNSNVNAANTSPARVPEAITVGASDINDAKASFSNYGPVVDIWAPGVSVISAYCCGTSNTASLSGTSMATPHVAGVSALYLSKHGKVPAAEVAAGIKAVATPNVLTGIPSGTVNLLAQVVQEF